MVSYVYLDASLAIFSLFISFLSAGSNESLKNTEHLIDGIRTISRSKFNPEDNSNKTDCLESVVFFAPVKAYKVSGF